MRRRAGPFAEMPAWAAENSAEKFSYKRPARFAGKNIFFVMRALPWKRNLRLAWSYLLLKNIILYLPQSKWISILS